MGRVVNKADYTFNKVAKTITFSSTYTGIELSQIQLITDVTNSTIIYQFNKSGYGGTLAGLVLTLTYNTNTGSFNNTDDLMIIVNESQDNTQLYSGTLSATGATSGILTTDQQTISIQISGTWEGVVNVEGSNDGTNYVPLMVSPVNEFSLIDNIGQNGIFTLATSTKFIRLNVQQLQSGTITALVLGRTVDGPNAADVLSVAMDKTQNTPLNVQEVNPLKRDSSNALVMTDMAGPYYYYGPSTTQPYFPPIDTTGYNTLVVQVPLIVVQIIVQGSNDGINWINLNMYQWNTGNTVSTISTTGVWVAPLYMKFVRVTTQGSAQTPCAIIAYLRNLSSPIIGTQFPVSVQGTAAMNLSQVGGNSVTTYGATGPTGVTQPQAGTLAVGGGATVGTTVVPNAIIIGGRQAPTPTALGGTTRTMLMDSDGRVQIATDQTKGVPALLGTPGTLQVTSNNIQNGGSLNVTDLSQFEGQSVIELLAQILLELRISNQYSAELPQQLNAGYNNLDDPTQFRNEQSAFNI